MQRVAPWFAGQSSVLGTGRVYMTRCSACSSIHGLSRSEYRKIAFHVPEHDQIEATPRYITYCTVTQITHTAQASQLILKSVWQLIVGVSRLWKPRLCFSTSSSCSPSTSITSAFPP